VPAVDLKTHETELEHSTREEEKASEPPTTVITEEEPEEVEEQKEGKEASLVVARDVEAAAIAVEVKDEDRTVDFSDPKQNEHEVKTETSPVAAENQSGGNGAGNEESLKKVLGICSSSFFRGEK